MEFLKDFPRKYESTEYCMKSPSSVSLDPKFKVLSQPKTIETTPTLNIDPDSNATKRRR